MNLLEHSFPHLDAVVNGTTTTPAIAPAYRTEMPFRCCSAKDRGTREALTADREAEWVIIDGGPEWDAYGTIPRFGTKIGLQMRIDVKATAKDAKLEGHALATGLLGDFITADRKGVTATTGILSIRPTTAPVVYSLPPFDGEGEPPYIIMTIEFTLMHGDC